MLSDNCHSNLPPPTGQGFCAWLAIAQQRLDRLAHTPATSLGDLEIAVVEELHRLGASLLTQAANRQAQATAFLCSRCQQPLAREEPCAQNRLGCRPSAAQSRLRLVSEMSGLVLPRRCPMGPAAQCASFPSCPRDGSGSSAQNALRASRTVTASSGRLLAQFNYSPSRGLAPRKACSGSAAGGSASGHHRRGRRSSGCPGRPSPKAFCAHY